MRLIDADALRRRKELRFGLMAAITTIQFLIDEAPTVEERKHGRWVRHNDIIACSECIFDMCFDENIAELNYCPNCGAIMDGQAICDD